TTTNHGVLWREPDGSEVKLNCRRLMAVLHDELDVEFQEFCGDRWVPMRPSAAARAVYLLKPCSGLRLVSPGDRRMEPQKQSAKIQVSDMTEWQNLEYAIISRDRLEDLAALAADGDTKALRLHKAINEWDVEAPCINCKARPLPQPEGFVLVLKDDGTTWG